MTTGEVKQQDLVFSLFKLIVSDDQTNYLVEPPTPFEVWEIVKNLNSWKAPRVDGMNAEFFKKSWNVIGEDITNLICDFFKENVLPISVNETPITHIQKELGSRRVEQFRPISLCNEIYKIITKILANRFKKILPLCVGEEQSAFSGTTNSGKYYTGR